MSTNPEKKIQKTKISKEKISKVKDLERKISKKIIQKGKIQKILLYSSIVWKDATDCFFFIFALNDLMNRSVIDVLSNYVYSISLLLIIELYHSLSLHCCTRDDSNARSASRKLMTLGLLPVNQVELTFNDIATDSLHCIE